MRHGARSCAQMAHKKAPKMPRPDSQAIGEAFHASLFKASFANESKCAGDSIRSAEPCWCSRRTLRTATKTRAKPSLSGRSGAWIVANVTFAGSAGRANRTTINSGRKYGYKKLAVETRISRKPCSRTDLPIQHYDLCQNEHQIAALNVPPFHIIIHLVAKVGRFRTAQLPGNDGWGVGELSPYSRIMPEDCLRESRSDKILHSKQICLTPQN